MNDKDIMEGILLTTKGVCDLYMHGSIESATPNVHQTFNAALNDALCMQNNIYNEMAQHGWYPSEQAQPQQIHENPGWKPCFRPGFYMVLYHGFLPLQK